MTREYHPLIAVFNFLQLRNLFSHHFDEVILAIARLLKNSPVALYRLNPLFYPFARVELNAHHSPITSLVLKTPNASRIVFLDSQNGASCTLHDLSIFELHDILIHRFPGDEIYDDLHNVADPALRDCLAQLTQDVRISVCLQTESSTQFLSVTRRTQPLKSSSEGNSEVFAIPRRSSAFAPPLRT